MTTLTTMYRKTTCNGCGYTQETSTSYYLDRKAWKAGHTADVHRQRMVDQDVEAMIEYYFGERIALPKK